MNNIVIQNKAVLKVVITETLDTFTNTLDKQMFVSNTKDSKIIYKVKGNYSIILESLYRQYGYQNIDTNELNEKDSINYLLSINKTLLN